MQEKLPAAIRKVWTISALLTIFWWLVAAAGLFAGHILWNWPLWLLAFPAALAVLQPIIMLSLVPYRYQFWRYRITDTAVYMQKGAIIQSEEAVPITRVQNVTLSSGPILRHFQLQEVNIETASTSHKIDGLTKPVAEKLRDQILLLAKEARDEG
ncbi:PH domain-containing protein [Lacticaseibacillus mingshuiensis]|uniref:PH domain-containing protein n=1 Tax=Lacticaseibacillus mingshuiensis TaxID=2799574 RepID=A0ABW4CHH8_9LACO|nr:PH domain-containing protein [Lacticaseibacillus mingshuiensis]